MKLIGRILLFLAFFFLLLEWQERDYSARGEIVEAVVTQKVVQRRARTSGTGRRTDHVIFYRFSTPEGETFEGRSDVLLETWNRTREGGPVTVEYKRDFPGTNRIVGQVAGAGFWWKAAAVLAMLGLAALILDRRKASETLGPPGPDGPRPVESATPDTPAKRRSRR
ncbi:MAG: DUF3592 domain-containing protein [Gammaproteobacteria bacterium]